MFMQIICPRGLNAVENARDGCIKIMFDKILIEIGNSGALVLLKNITKPEI